MKDKARREPNPVAVLQRDLHCYGRKVIAR